MDPMGDGKKNQLFTMFLPTKSSRQPPSRLWGRPVIDEDSAGCNGILAKKGGLTPWLM
jgi:hypothetical protein